MCRPPRGARCSYNCDMLIRKAPDVRSSEITPKNVYLRRREFLQASAAALVAAGYGSLAGPADAQARTKLKGPIKKSPLSVLGPNDKINQYQHVTTYNNFYEFGRSEEHTSELQSQSNLVCRLLLEKKKKKK